MKGARWVAGVIVGCVAGGMVLLGAGRAGAQDWPQWRGANRDAKVTGFKAPASWPKELSKKWKVAVGEGVATPALVGERLYVFARQETNEVIRCLDAASGKELWQDKYEVQGATRPAAGFNNEFVGPRASPTVAEGKIVTFGVRGTLSCLDAASGKMLWRKDDFKGAWPTFFTSSSPLIVGGLCIAQLGGRSNGAIVAYDLSSGDQKWKWTGDSPSYASPVLMTLGGAKLIVAMTETKIVAVGAADGKLVWETPFAVKGFGGYNAATPIAEGQTMIYAGSGRGATAVKLEKKGDNVAAKELWSNKEKSVQFNTPLLKNGLLYGLTQGNEFFCLSARDGKTAWSAPAGKPSGGGKGRGPRGYGSIVDAGPVLLALTPSAQLVVFEPTDKEFKQIASYKVADGETYAYPVIAGNRIFVKDRESLTLWTIE
jgi:outer membrane protein assembly factor BamB